MGSCLTLVFQSWLITPALKADSKPEHPSLSYLFGVICG